MDVSPCMVTITKTGVNKIVLCDKFLNYQNLSAFEAKPIHLDNLPVISFICFFYVFCCI